MLLLVAIGCLLLAFGLTIWLQATILRRVANWIGAREITFRRSLLTVVCIALACLAIALPAASFSVALDEASLAGPDTMLPWVQGAIPYLVFGLEIAAACLIVRWLWGALWDQAALAALVNLVGLLAVTYLLNALVRLFFFETVIVPTGGMAPAVCGLHATISCPNCGCTYDVGMSERMLVPRWSQRKAKPTQCPNCHHRSTVDSAAPVRQGERILIDKRVDCRRWELVVMSHVRKPGALQLNRLVGQPGESVEILAGDVFIDGRLLQKPPEALADMWILVHDTAFVPAQPPQEPIGWRPMPGSKWHERSGHWTVSAADSNEEVLEYTGRIEDDLAYNDRLPGQPPPANSRAQPNRPAENGPGIGSIASQVSNAERPDLPGNGRDSHDNPVPTPNRAPAVADIRLECSIENCSGGRLELRWESLQREVLLQLAASGDLRMTVRDLGQTQLLPPQEVRGTLAGGLQSGAQFTFVERDGLAYVAQSGRVVASLTVGPDGINAMRSRRARSPDAECRLRLTAHDTSITLGRLRLQRDVYYRTLPEMPGMAPGVYIATPEPTPLPHNAFFVLGDNSARSEDSRFFGPVAANAITGTARWVYWPAQRWRHL